MHLFLEKRTYEKVVESFTQEWKATQEEILKASKEQEKEFLGDIQEILYKSREETAKLLEADRQENVKMLNTVLSMMQSNVQSSPLALANIISNMINPSSIPIIYTQTSPPITPDISLYFQTMKTMTVPEKD